MRMTTVRNYGKHEDALGIPNLIDVQQAAYERFLQSRRTYEQRDVVVRILRTGCVGTRWPRPGCSRRSRGAQTWR